MSAVRQAFGQLDARWFQILFLSSFLLLGVWGRDFELRPTQLLMALAVALAVQALWLFGLDIPGRFKLSSYLSPVVSSLGVCILVRSNNYWAHPLLLGIAMSSKFLIRAGPAQARSHVFNPANLAAFLALMVLPDAWLSPGQWGSSIGLALCFLALGGIVTGRISRWQTSAGFLLVWGLLLMGRLQWLQFPLDLALKVWVQQMSSGATLLFAFFMISDPMTTPQRASVRLAFVALVAFLAFYWQFVLYRPQGLIVALAVLSASVPLLNWRWQTARFEWSGSPSKAPS